MKRIWNVCLFCWSLVTNSYTHLLGSINPVLTMRFALSLKRSADSGQVQEWGGSTQIASADFTGSSLSPVRVYAAREGIEMGLIHPQKDQPLIS